MDKSYRTYFRERLAELEPSRAAIVRESLRRLRTADVDRQADEAARSAVRAAREELGSEGYVLREDAELLILLLARELVARPVSAVQRGAAYEISEAVAQDARMIALRAAQEAPDREVSAHRVIDGLSGVWDDLQSGRFNIWDRKWDDRKT